MDLRIGNNFELVFNKDFLLVDGIDEQKQKLFIFLKTLKGSLSYVPNWGLDYFLFLKLFKINNLKAVKNYFYEISKDLNLDI
ncbi:GPW/gp25 family protein, partial [Borreliella bavariensis]